MDASTLLDILDEFLEATTRAQKQRIVAPAERKIEKIMRSYFAKCGRIFAREHKRYEGKYSEAIGGDELTRIMEMIGAETEEELVAALQKPMGEVMGMASANLIASVGFTDTVGIAFDLKNPKAVAFLQEHAAKLVKGISEETRSQLGTLLTRATDEGWAYNKTAKEIRTRFEQFANPWKYSKEDRANAIRLAREYNNAAKASRETGIPAQTIRDWNKGKGLGGEGIVRSRAESIAVTESRFAYESANKETALSLRDAGLEMEKSWLAEEDACDDCADNGSDWIPVEEDFVSGDPPVHPNCRCDVLYQRVGAGE